ncbi:hypothetical protein [Runella sp. SP2]|uniref:hypothetical protein n=1 Tax=Runella sp. SP2 TaxID=2268026 RepID=UPI000F099889|nr:hypothetical protein [Runella sp. SP2]AYQ31382.1 hypothetical protein DTQ70_03955 [Runella sp. SP2]
MENNDPDYSFPPGFVPGGNVIINPDGGGNSGGGNPGGGGSTENPNWTLDEVPTEGSNNPIKSNAVYQAFQNVQSKLPEAPENSQNEYVLTGNKTWRHLPSWVNQLIEGLNIDNGGGEQNQENNYVTLTQLGAGIVEPTLNQQTAALYVPFAVTIPRSTFKLENNQNATVSLINAPAGASVTIDNDNVQITWTPLLRGEHYIGFWLGNNAKLGKAVSLKINVTKSTIVPVGDQVLASASLTAGMLINIWDDGGTPKVRPAIATSADRIAHGFITQNAAPGQTVVPKFWGTNSLMEGLEIGKRYFLSSTTPGGISEFGPASGSGLVWQPVGRAISATELLVDIDEHVIRS